MKNWSDEIDALGALKDKWVVLMDLPWLPPGMRENSMDLFGLAAEKVAKERPNRTGIHPLSEFAGKWWYATVVPSPFLWTFGSFSTEQIAAFISEGRRVRAIQGPFDTEGQAQYALDVAWEAPD
jgi:hypothetical protein